MPDLARTVSLLQLFGEPSRVRLAALLSGRELTVAELTAITELAQSRVSTHLARLREAGVLRDRRVGASTFYSMNDGAMPPDARELWDLLARRVDDGVLEGDRDRCDKLLASRNRAAWPELVAGEMERHYSPGRTWESLAKGLTDLLALGDVLDVGAGDGTVGELLAPASRSYTCVDRSPRLAAAAAARLAGAPRVRATVGDAHALPFPDRSFDQVILFHVLDQVDKPARVLAECARVLRPGGALAVLTLDRHKHRDVVAAYGHVHDGFAPATLRRMLERSRLRVDRCAVTTRERRRPHFQVVGAIARKKEASS